MRDGVSRDVSNLQTSKLKPAVQQNRTPALFARLLLLLLSLLPTCTLPYPLPPCVQLT
jgi:hypothetical protein